MSVSRKETLLVIKQRILGLAAAFGLLSSVAFASTAQALGDEHLTVYADVNSVAQITLSTNSLVFGQDLTFIGGGSGYADSCYNNNNGWAFVAPTINVNVKSSTPWNLIRNISGGTEIITRTQVQNGDYSTCANHIAFRGPVTGVPAGGTTFTTGTDLLQTFSFDVLPGDPSTNGYVQGSIDYSLQI
jgi:hypothetical protein